MILKNQKLGLTIILCAIIGIVDANSDKGVQIQLLVAASILDKPLVISPLVIPIEYVAHLFTCWFIISIAASLVGCCWGSHMGEGKVLVPLVEAITTSLGQPLFAEIKCTRFLAFTLSLELLLGWDAAYLHCFL